MIRRYLSPETARAMAVEIANATFAVRAASVWGAGSTAVASDSKHFGAFDQNIFTEWHSRYGGRGVLIYWHVERGSMAIHSQLISLLGVGGARDDRGRDAARHRYDVDGNYTDTHGQSQIGFGITRLLGFDLLPRIKQINKVSCTGRPRRPDAYPGPAARADPADPLGADHPAVRPDDQVRHRDPDRHRLDRSDPAPVQPANASTRPTRR